MKQILDLMGESCFAMFLLLIDVFLFEETTLQRMGWDFYWRPLGWDLFFMSNDDQGGSLGEILGVLGTDDHPPGGCCALELAMNFFHWEFHIIPTEARRDFSAKNHQPALRLTMAPWALISRRKRASQPLPSCWCPRSTRPGNIWESFATTKRGFCWGKR